MKKYLALFLALSLLVPYAAVPMRASADEADPHAEQSVLESAALWYSGLNDDISPFGGNEESDPPQLDDSSITESSFPKEDSRSDAVTSMTPQKKEPKISRENISDYEYEVIVEDVGDDDTDAAKSYISITRYIGSDSSVIIPDTIDGVNVEQIGSNAFDGCTELTEITLPDALTVIGYGAFQRCSNLKTVNFGNSLERIGAKVFADCVSLETLVLPDSVLYIEYGAFENCTALTSVNYPKSLDDLVSSIFDGCESLVDITIPDGTERVASRFFSNASALTSVELPESIKTIDEYAFAGCKALKEITIPANVTLIGSNAFEECGKLTSVKMSDGIQKIGYSCFSGCASLAEIEIPDTVSEIGAYAFENCTSLAEFHYPKDLKEIGGSVFENCDSLKKVAIGEGVREIPSYLFKNAPALEEVILPSTIKEIGSYAFEGAVNLKSLTIPEGAVTIKYRAFGDCVSLETIVLPDSIESIESYAFENCSALSEIHYPRSLVSGGSGIFNGCSSLTAVDIPDDVTVLADSAFAGAPVLESVILPETLTAVGDEAFFECAGLKNIKIPDSVKEIGQRAFSGCSSLSDVTFGSTLKVIGYSCFSECTSLVSADLPDTVESIGGSAFYGCTSLSDVHYPSGLTEVGGSVFENCDSLKKAEIPEGVTQIPDSVFKGASSLEEIILPSTIKEIGNYSFEQCSLLNKIGLPEGLTAIGYRAFGDCGNLDNVHLPDTVEKIESYAFENCTSLTAINYPLSVTEMGMFVFAGDTSLTTVIIPEGVTELPDNFLSGSMIENIELPSTLTVIGSRSFENCLSLGKVVIPEGVTNIGYSAFSDCESLSEIVLPDTIREINSYAFQNCKSLEKLHYPVSLETTGSEIVEGCDSLKEIEIPEGVKKLADNVFSGLMMIDRLTLPDSIEEIGWGTFRDCKALTYIGLPKNLKTIDDYAFSGCISLVRVDIPDSVTAIGYAAFEDCANLMQINYPLSLTKSGIDVFEGCGKLTRISVPEGVEVIPEDAYYRASSLTEVILPSTLKKISANAFYDCKGLSTIAIPESVTEIDESAFYGCDNITLLMPNYTKSLPRYIERGINFKITKNDKQAETAYLNTNSCLYTTNFSSEVNGGSISVTLRYSVNSSKYYSLEQKYLTVRIPDNCELYEKSLYYNGEFCNDFNVNGKIVEIPVKAATGTVTFSLSKEEAGNIVSYALFNYGWGSEEYEVIGIINADIPTLSVDCGSITNSSEITVSGIAPSSTDVNIYIDEKLAAVTRSNKSGEYSAALTLPSVSDGNVYHIRAAADADEEKQLEAFTVVKYSTMAPVLASFVMIYRGGEYDLQNSEKLNLTFVPGVPYRFEIKFTNYYKVREVYVTSDRNNITKRMPAKLDEKSGTFVAEGFFDENDTSYVPGKMNVYYTEEGSMLDFADDLALDSDIYNELFEGATAEVITDTDEKSEVVISFPDGSQTTVSQQIVTPQQAANEIEGLPDYVSLDITDPNELGSTLDTLAKGTASVDGSNVYYQEISDNGSVKIWTFDTVAGVVTQAVVDEGKDYILGKVIGEWGIGSIVGNADAGGFIFSTVYGTFNNVSDYTNMMSNISDTRESIRYSNLSDAEKQRRFDILDSYERQTKSVLLIKTCFTFINAAVDISGLGFTPYGIAIKAGTFILGGIMLGLMQYQMELNLKYLRGNNRNSVINWAIDPSGYVYEAVTTNRLRGVKATVYFIPFEEDGDQTETPDGSQAELWKASEYGQQNPLFTDADGCYAWDVPEGWWQVRFELDGYETGYSDWVAVPPPQTNVNISLASLAAPKVESVEIEDSLVRVTFDSYIDPATAENIFLTDRRGESVKYALDYSREEKSGNGTVYAKTFTLSVNDSPDVLNITVPETVKSYCGVSCEPFTSKLIIRAVDPDNTDTDIMSDIDTDISSETDTDSEIDSSDTDMLSTDSDESDTDISGTDSDITSDDDPNPPVVSVYLLGDVDADVTVTASDALMILRISVGLGDPSYELSVVSDVNGDNNVDSADALEILRFSVGLSDNNMIGKPLDAA